MLEPVLIETVSVTEAPFYTGFATLEETATVAEVQSTTTSGGSFEDTLIIVESRTFEELDRSIFTDTVIVTETFTFGVEVTQTATQKVNPSEVFYYLLNDLLTADDESLVNNTYTPYTNQGGATCRADQEWPGVTPPTWRGSLSLVGDTTLTLRQPDLGDNVEVVPATIQNRTLIGEINQYKNSAWKDYERYRLTFSIVEFDDLGIIINFLNDHLGRVVTLQYYDGQDLTVILSNIQGPFTIQGQGSCHYQFTIEVESVPS